MIGVRIISQIQENLFKKLLKQIMENRKYLLYLLTSTGLYLIDCTCSYKIGEFCCYTPIYKHVAYTKQLGLKHFCYKGNAYKRNSCTRKTYYKRIQFPLPHPFSFSPG